MFQKACSDAWGVSAPGVLAICEAYQIEDIEDCLDRTLDLANQTRDDEPVEPVSTGTP